jgi:uncharacterized protein YndB with AHSA1/START domain
MTTQAQDASVRTDVVVDGPPERAFTVFTEGIGTWWPSSHHLLEGELAEMVFEPFEGGSIIDRGVDGTESRWARVLAYEPPHRVVFSWDITLGWEIETDPSRASEVEVTFAAEAAGRTRVTLEHRHLERHGEGWEAMRSAVGSENGWGAGLRGFAEAVGRE